MSYVRVGITGTSVGGEVWSINPVFDPTGEFPGGVDQTKLDAATLAIANLAVPGTMTVALSTAMSITGARVEVREDSNDSLIAISTAARTTAATGGSVPRMPLQSALVVSLRTNTPGGSGRGRLYYPATGLSLVSTARVATADVVSLLGAMKTYLLSIRTALAAEFTTIGFDLAVRSKQTHTTPHVVRLQMGDVPDTQRRRRDKEVESYSSTTFPV